MEENTGTEPAEPREDVSRLLYVVNTSGNTADALEAALARCPKGFEITDVKLVYAHPGNTTGPAPDRFAAFREYLITVDKVPPTESYAERLLSMWEALRAIPEFSRIIESVFPARPPARAYTGEDDIPADLLESLAGLDAPTPKQAREAIARAGSIGAVRETLAKLGDMLDASDAGIDDYVDFKAQVEEALAQLDEVASPKRPMQYFSLPPDMDIEALSFSERLDGVFASLDLALEMYGVELQPDDSCERPSWRARLMFIFGGEHVTMDAWAFVEKIKERQS